MIARIFDGGPGGICTRIVVEPTANGGFFQNKFFNSGANLLFFIQ
jgi:hypothetical protein